MHAHFVYKLIKMPYMTTSIRVAVLCLYVEMRRYVD